MSSPPFAESYFEDGRFDFSAGTGSAFRTIYTSLMLVRDVRILIPVAAYLAIEMIFMFLYLASLSEPWVSMWAILVEGLSGEDLSHFPGHLIFMQPVLGRFDIAMEILVHALFQGAVVVLAANSFRNRRVSLGEAFRTAARLYPHLVGVSLVASVLIFAAVNITGRAASNLSGPAGLAVRSSGIFAGLVVQALFLYALPAIITGRKRWTTAISWSVRIAWRFAALSFMMVLVPFLITVPTTFLSMKAEMIALQLSPEFMIHNHVASSIMESIASYLITVGATVLFIQRVRRSGSAAGTDGEEKRTEE